MRNGLMLAALVAVVALAGFECTIDGAWVAGDDCVYALDYDEFECLDNVTLLQCNSVDFVETVNCQALCPGGVGTCQLSGWDQDFCACDIATWSPGFGCSYSYEYASSECLADGDTIYYCADDNLIYEQSCNAYCLSQGADFGSCGLSTDLGYNGCICEFPPTCTANFCYDILTLYKCVDGLSYDAINCETDCAAQGFDKGVCDLGECACG